MVHKNINGSTLIMAIIAIIVIGALGVGMQQMSSSAVFNQLMFNQANQARNLAYSGVKYTKGLIHSYQTLGKTFTQFKDDLTANGGVYDLGNSSGKFVVTVPSYTTTGNTTSFTVSALGKTPDGPFQSQYQLPSNVSLSYTYSPTVPPVNPKVPKVLMYGKNVQFSGNTYTGDSIFKEYSFNGGVTIRGSLDYIGSGAACLVVQGTSIGLLDGTSHVCSNSCVKVQGGVTIYGTINAVSYVDISNGIVNGDIYSGSYVTKSSGQAITGDIYAVGDVTLTNGTVTGDIHSGGNVSLKGASVNGNIYAVGNVTVENGTVSKNVTSGNNVSMVGWSSHINGDVNYYGSWSPPPSYGQFTGTLNKITTKPTSPTTPSSCTSLTLPTYVSKTTTKSDPNSNKSITYTISSSTNLNDKTWVFPSFNMTNGGSHLCLDFSTSNSYINIFVNGNFMLEGSVQLKTPTSGSCKEIDTYSMTELKSYAKQIYMEVGGTTTLKSSAHDWIGTIFSQGNISGSSTLDVVGALYSNGTIDSNGGSNSTFVMSDYANTYW